MADVPQNLIDAINDLERLFTVDQARLKKITEKFVTELEKGLAKDGENIPMNVRTPKDICPLAFGLYLYASCFRRTCICLRRLSRMLQLNRERERTIVVVPTLPFFLCLWMYAF
jgi:hypothetical protein